MWKRAVRRAVCSTVCSTVCSALLAVPAAVRAAPALATVTIVDSGSPVVLIRDASRLALAEGVRLQKNDILESGPQARMVRVEFADGSIADLGPDTRLLLAPRPGAERGHASPPLYLLHGWAKLTAPRTEPAVPVGLASPAFDVSQVARQVVVSVSPGEAYAFAEAGTVNLVERVNARPAAPLTLKSDQFFARSGNDKPTLGPRPSAAFVARVPKPFLDTLPSRLALFASREVQPKRLGELAYADAEPWIDAEAALRPLFLGRWRSQAQVPEFRKGLLANMKAHPEWDRVLFPEKYLPKPSAGSAPAAGYSR